MDKEFEHVTIKTADHNIIDGDINLRGNNRVSELFTAADVVFIEINNTSDNLGLHKDTLFLSKDHIVWVKPTEERINDSEEYKDRTHYELTTVKTVGGVIIEGDVNYKSTPEAEDYFDFYNEKHPFIIMRDGLDNHGNAHHTLFINKKSILSIELD